METVWLVEPRRLARHDFSQPLGFVITVRGCSYPPMNGIASMIAIHPDSRRKLEEWSRRYLPAEILGSFTALTAAWTVHAVSNSLIAAAIAGSIGESLGYYSYIAIRELRHIDARHRHHGSPKPLWLTGTRIVRDMLIEFGPAELVDSFLARPFFMYLMPTLLDNFTAGLIAGKLGADVVFYSLAITSYEIKKQYLPLPQPKDK